MSSPGFLRQSYVGNRLRDVERKQSFDRLYFDDDQVLHQDVDHIRALESPAAVRDAEGNPGDASQAAIFKFPQERRNVCALEQPGPEGFVHRNAC